MNTTPPDNIVARVRKLLALSNDKGATEAEASLAAAKAAELMEEYLDQHLTQDNRRINKQ